MGDGDGDFDVVVQGGGSLGSGRGRAPAAGGVRMNGVKGLCRVGVGGGPEMGVLPTAAACLAFLVTEN